MKLDHEMRCGLKKLIDRTIRAERAEYVRSWRYCAGCECEYSEHTAGCRTCSERHRNRKRYAPKPTGPLPDEILAREQVVWSLLRKGEIDSYQALLMVVCPPKSLMEVPAHV